MSPQVRRDQARHLSEAEMQVVLMAREQSRREAKRLDQLKRVARERLFENSQMTEAEFERSWPQFCAETAGL